MVFGALLGLIELMAMGADEEVGAGHGDADCVQGDVRIDHFESFRLCAEDVPDDVTD